MSLDNEFKDEIVYGSFWQVEIPGEGKFSYPTEDYTSDEIMALFEVDEVEEITGYFVEVLDDETGELVWHGPFDNEDEVTDYLDDLQ